MSGIFSFIARSLTVGVILLAVTISLSGMAGFAAAPAPKLEGGKEGLAAQYNPKELSVDKAVPSPSPSPSQTAAQQVQGRGNGKPTTATWDLATGKK